MLNFSDIIIIGDTMETLKQYFSYNKDCDLSGIFYLLSRKMKVIHQNAMYVPVVDANHIVFDNDFSFDNMALSSDFINDRKNNIENLAKIFIGAFLSLGTEFYDLSQVDNNWLINNLDEISSSITADSYPKDYFESVLLNGKDNYYCDYLEKLKNSSELNNSLAYKKVLSNAGSKYYQDQSEIDTSAIEKKVAFINYLFYPVLILSIFIVCFVIYICFNF